MLVVDKLFLSKKSEKLKKEYRENTEKQGHVYDRVRNSEVALPVCLVWNKSENRCCHCLLFRVRFSVLNFKNYYFSPLKGSTHWCLC